MKKLLLIIVTISTLTLTGKAQGFGQLALGTSSGAGNSTSGTQGVVNTGSGLETNFMPDYSIVEETPATVVTLQGLESRITVLSEIFIYRIGRLNKNAVVYSDKKDVGYGNTKDFTNIFVNGRYITSIQISNGLYAKIETERKNLLSNVQVGEFIPRLCVAQSAQIDEVITLLPEKVAPVIPNNEGSVVTGGSNTTIINNYYYSVQEPAVENLTNNQNPMVYYQQSNPPAQQVCAANTTSSESTWWQRRGDAVGTGILAGAVGFAGGYILGNYTGGTNNVYTTYAGSTPIVGGSNVIGTTTTTGGTLIGGSNTGN